jgi:GTPase involved in cell partitioning and DNA repair
MAKRVVNLRRDVERLQKEMLTTFDKYQELRQELKKHEGKLVDDVGLDVLNPLIESIQEEFHKLLPVFRFIQSYHQFSLNVTASQSDLIDAMKKAGAQEKNEDKIVH